MYVDDLLIICKNIRKITIIKQLLAKEFEMTDIGNASTFLGMHIEQDKKNSTISMSQEHYLKNVLRKFGMEECKSAATPIEKGLRLEFGDVNHCSRQAYREMIGCLTYATLTRRPDLCAAVNYFSTVSFEMESQMESLGSNTNQRGNKRLIL